MANYQVQAPDGSIHVIAGPDGATPEEVMAQAQSLIPQGQPSLGDTLKGDLVNAVNQDQQIKADKNLNPVGEAGAALRVGSNLMQKGVGDVVGAVTPDVVKSGLTGISHIIEKAGSYVPGLSAYDQSVRNFGENTEPALEKSAPNTMAVLGGLTSLASAGAMPAAAEGGATLLSKGAGLMRGGLDAASDASMARAAAKASTPAPATAADVGNAVKQNYDLSRYLNEQFAPDQVTSPFLKSVGQAEATNLRPATAGGTLSEDQLALQKQLGDVKSMLKGGSIDLNGIDTVDKALSAKIGAETNPQGDVSPNGRIYTQLKSQLRNIVANAPTDGTTALTNGRNAAFAQFKLNDLAAADERAEVQGGSPANYQSQYRRLFNDKDGFMLGLPDDIKEQMRVAATPSIADRLRGIPAHAVAVATGNLAGAAGVEGGKLLMDSAKSAVIKGRGQAVRQAIIDNAMSKMKDIDVTPQYPEQKLLPSPENMSRLPLNDSQLNIMRKGLNRPMPSSNETPINQPNGIPLSPSNIAGRLKRGGK